MPIKFKCPNPSCRKTLSVKDELAGKKAACPACKKVLTIPVPPTVATPSPPAPGQDAEALAAHFLADEPKVTEEEPKTIDFTCPYCDEELHLDVELAGKQAPCPECGRIVKVPQLVKQQKADWRGGAAGIPSGARRDTEPAPEGAWGSTTKTVVSGDALEEAGALPSQRREPVTLARWIMRGMLAAAAVGVLVVGVLLVISWLGGKRQEKLLAKAMEALSANKVTGASGAVLHMAAGQYHLRRNEKDSIKPDKGNRGAKNQFEAARNRLRDRTPDCDALLIELAEAQLGMAGSPAEVTEGKRVSWADALKEAGLTLLSIREPQQRMQGLRQVTRLLIAKEQAPLARDLARQLGGPEPLAVVALEYFRAGQKEDAARFLETIKPTLQPRKGPTGKPLPVPLSVDVVALLVVLGDDKAVPAPKEDTLKDVVLVGKAAGFAWRGQPEEARKLIAKASSALVRLEALVAAADAPSADNEAFTADAIALAEKKEGLPGWLMVRLVREGLHANVPEEKLLGLAQQLAPKDPMRGWVEMPIFRARLARAEGKAEESLLELVDKGTLAHAQACVELARHNTLKDNDTDKAVDKWDEALRPFGYIGVALGLQPSN
jgi:hypothetical protein